MSGPYHAWLEPVGSGTDLEEGMRARVADPVWFLTRQWQLGEHQGEDASAPVAVMVEVNHLPLTYQPAHPELDPTVIPGEALVEAEPGDWWTVGRRIRLGQAARAQVVALGLTPEASAALQFGPLEPPYSAFAGQLDGRAVYEAGVLAGQPLWAEVRKAPADNWRTDRLCFQAGFDAGGTALSVNDHDGGDVDWFTVDGPGSGPVAPAVPRRTVIPGRLSYPGAPNPRWWQIEDAQVDIGGFAPDRSHLGSMLLYDVALAHADDWFWFPVPPPAPPAPGGDPPPSSGVVVTA